MTIFEKGFSEELNILLENQLDYIYYEQTNATENEDFRIIGTLDLIF